MVVALPLGIGGALIGGLLGSLLGGEAAAGSNYVSLMTAIIGSLVVLISYRTYAMRAMA
jgi:uncharacterized membrane protein YeaQ/YmgE (transglycosylase-associated protein family)